MLDFLKNRTVLVTGAAGTVGGKLCERLLPVAKAVRAFDHAESELFFLEQRLHGLGGGAVLRPMLGDIRDLDRLRFALQGVDVVFHAAALKHVGLGEYNPFEVVQSNLIGLDNVIRASLDCNVDRMIFTSSDKAVNPTNVMGASKMMGERLVIAANEIRGSRRTVFCAVRFGNVIGSRGSVVPIFAQQLLARAPITLTDGEMTRYVMSIDEAATLVLEAAANMRGGEIFVTKMRALRIVDLAHAMAELLGVPMSDVRVTGARPGEKLYEELLSRDELPRSREGDRLLTVFPNSLGDIAGGWTEAEIAALAPVNREWNSSTDTFMDRPDIVKYLRDEKVLAPFLTPGAFS